MRALAIFAAVAVLLVLVVDPTSAKDISVGDEYGWTLNFNYQAWADGKEFHVGDRLIFNYTKGAHNVIKVDGVGFQECSRPDGVAALASGNDVIPLVDSGKKWYICGVPNHCASGMKLLIDVSATNTPLGSPAMPIPAARSSAHSELIMAPDGLLFASVAAAFGVVFMMII